MVLFKHWGWMVALILLLTVLSSQRLGVSIWLDEQRTLYYAGAIPQYGPASISTLIERIAENQWQAPLYYLILGLWGWLMGWSPFTLRTLSLFAGLLAVALTFRVSRKIALQSTNPHVHKHPENVAFYAAFTLSVSAFYMHYLVDMRAYTLFLLLTVVMLWAYQRLTSGRGSLSVALALLALSVAALLYTHYFALLAVAGLGLQHLILRYGKPHYWLTILAFLLGGVSFLPWLGPLIGGAARATEDARQVASMSPLEMFNNVLYMFSNGSQALVIVLLMLSLRKVTPNVRQMWLWLGGSVGLVILVSQFFPAVTEIRYLVFLWLPLSVLCAVGIQNLRGVGNAPVWILLAWAGLAVWHHFDPMEQRRIRANYVPPMEEIITALEHFVTEDDALLFIMPPDTPYSATQAMMDYYTYGLPLKRGSYIRDNYATTDQFYAQQIHETIADSERVWLTYETSQRNWRVGPVEQTLLPETGYTFCGELVTHDDVSIHLYAREPQLQSDDLRFNNITLHPFQFVHNDSEVLHAVIGWTTEDNFPPETYSLGIHIENSNGQVVAQADYGLQVGSFHCQLTSISTVALPAGPYTVRLVVYDWRTGVPLLYLGGTTNRPVAVEFVKS